MHFIDKVVIAIFLVGAVGCGGSDKNNDPDAAVVGRDADPGADALDGVTWELAPALASQLELRDPADLNTERTTRIFVTTELSNCVLRAMPVIEWKEATLEVFIDMRVWRPLGLDCPAQTETIVRPVSLRFPQAGKWRVQTGTPDNPKGGIEVDILAPPARACDPQAAACEMDCDCPAGEVCLGASGFAGSYTLCTKTCELSRDCGGAGTCAEVGEVSYYCEAATPECGDVACPDGYTCTGNACEADFVLNVGARATCSSDNDCAAPLHCVQSSQGGGERRCEVLCPTDSAYWCTTGHACGLAANDVAAVAVSDSVCIQSGQ